MSALEKLTERFNTVAAMYHDAYARWEVRADTQRRTWTDCRWEGWGETLDEAVSALVRSEHAPS